MLAAARKLWRAPLLVLQHSSLLSTATCNSFAPTARNRARPTFWQNNRAKLAESKTLGNTALRRRLVDPSLGPRDTA